MHELGSFAVVLICQRSDLLLLNLVICEIFGILFPCLAFGADLIFNQLSIL
jgi:hypothetical protein